MSNRYELAVEMAERHGQAQPKSWRRAQIYMAMAAADLLMISLGFMIASVLWAGYVEKNVSTMLAFILPIQMLAGLNAQSYGMATLISPARSVTRAVQSFLWTMLAVICMGFLLKVGAEYSRAIAAIGAALSVALLIAGRMGVFWLGTRVLIDGPISKVILCDGTMLLPGPGETIINTAAAGLAPMLHDPMMLDRIGRAVRHADRVIVACAPDRRVAWATALKGAGVDTELLMPEFEELGVLGTDSYGDAITAIVARGPLGLRNRAIKRCFDLFIVAWLLPVLLGVTGLVALLIKLDDGGPVFFVQRRIGQGNRLFPMYKFRSMKAAQLDAGGVQSTQRGDSRITRVGRILRSTSIDELPQLFNVLKGDMSIVGPRPHALASTAGDALFWEVDQRYWGRHAAKPGLTGLAQVRGFRGATETASDLTNRVQADLEYLANWTIWRDMRIVAATFGVLLHHNAY
ncbi:sugar transferase [Sphingomonas naphthae]|uniref:Sugar transferase n=1 Tax=Sphingomonas naphthae TaxID=1813468 RepID=A0ABY7TPX7_9SPHN|nr:sugar transferase [Sphingomonas naphthae]WCT75083.1 sugar transferase [Sphingomonas naphthae]